MESVKNLASMLASDEPEMTDGYSEENMEETDGESVAAEEVMAAMQSGDAEAFKEALKSFISMCQ